jgi:hypothetical protein
LLELDFADNRMNGTVPDSIGKLAFLEELSIGDEYETNSNKFVGPLPSSMSNLISLSVLHLNVATLTGPLPDFSRLTQLGWCKFKPSQLCIIPELVPVNSKCDFTILPFCKLPDCEILADWLPKLFDVYTCCLVDGVTCEEDRVVILDLSKTETKKHIAGVIPMSIGELDNLQQLYLQDNFLEGNLPLSISNISSLQIVDISSNLLSGVLPFIPSFKLIGIESNLGLSLPIDLPTIIESPTDTPDLSQNVSTNESDITIPLIVGISTGSLLLFVLLVIAVVTRGCPSLRFR